MCVLNACIIYYNSINLDISLMKNLNRYFIF